MKLRTFVLVASPLGYNERKVFTLRNIFATPPLRGPPPQRPQKSTTTPGIPLNENFRKKKQNKNSYAFNTRNILNARAFNTKFQYFRVQNIHQEFLRVCKASLSNAFACDFWFKTESKMLKLFLFGKLAFSCTSSM